MSPSWYDLLDVPPDASADEVRAAWRAQLADLDPTDRRFAVLNEAAAVLLDPERRAAHDAELAGRASAPSPSPSRSPTTEPAPAPEPTSEPVPARMRRPRLPRRRTASTTTGAGTVPDVGTTTGAASAVTTGPDTRAGRRVPAWVPLVLGALTAAVVATTVWLVLTVPSDDEVLSGTRTAQAAAEQAVEPVLSYDFRTLDADKAAAASYLTDEFFDESYEPLFTQIEENAPSTKTVVDAQVRASAIVRGGVDRAQVLVLVDQVSTNAASAEPRTDRNQVTVTMERVGDRWLIDDLRTTRG